MTPLQKQIQQLLRGLNRPGTPPVTLDNGVCALVDDQGQEALVLEAPAESDALLLHCRLFDIAPWQETLSAWRLMMTLNFEMDAMRGCWLALDEDNQIRLCHQQGIDALNHTTFIPLVEAFMQQAREARELLTEMFTAR
ncbi:type III secretion system chaperone [Siccibacter turicensis]|uniref:type III secretion system chaperone n=1 Tax=Siccibacter turicensis TaxID=357233 RepID=UPI003F568F34